jgi:hypothetical protein
MKILGIIERKRNGITNYIKREQKILKQRYMMENDSDNILSSRKD